LPDGDRSDCEGQSCMQLVVVVRQGCVSVCVFVQQGYLCFHLCVWNALCAQGKVTLWIFQQSENNQTSDSVRHLCATLHLALLLVVMVLMVLMVLTVSISQHVESGTRIRLRNTFRYPIKGRVRPRTCGEGPEREQRHSSTLSLTSALDGDGRLTPRPGRFAPRGECRYPFYCGPQGRSLTPTGFDPQTVQPVVSLHYYIVLLTTTAACAVPIHYYIVLLTTTATCAVPKDLKQADKQLKFFRQGSTDMFNTTTPFCLAWCRLLCGRFPGFSRLSWWDQRIGKNEYCALLEWHCHFVHHKSYWPGIDPTPSRWEALNLSTVHVNIRHRWGSYRTVNTVRLHDYVMPLRQCVCVCVCVHGKMLSLRHQAHGFGHGGLHFGQLNGSTLKDILHLHRVSDHLTISLQPHTLFAGHSCCWNRPPCRTAFTYRHFVRIFIVISQLFPFVCHLCRPPPSKSLSPPHSAPSLPRPIVPTTLGTGSAQNKANLNSVLRATRRIVTSWAELVSSGGSWSRSRKRRIEEGVRNKKEREREVMGEVKDTKIWESDREIRKRTKEGWEKGENGGRKNGIN
jgi:hypothetical protein